MLLYLVSRLSRTRLERAAKGPSPASVMWQKKRFRSFRRVRGARWLIPASVMEVSARFSLCGCGKGKKIKRQVKYGVRVARKQSNQEDVRSRPLKTRNKNKDENKDENLNGKETPGKWYTIAKKNVTCNSLSGSTGTVEIFTFIRISEWSLYFQTEQVHGSFEKQ